MTEAEWVRWWRYLPDSKGWANRLAGHVTVRKVRLLACACCRRLSQHLTEEEHEMLLAAERHADGRANKSQLPKSLRDVATASGPGRAVALCAYFHSNLEFLIDSVRAARSVIAHRGCGRRVRPVPGEDSFESAVRREAEFQFLLVRDLFPKPGGRVTFAPAWLTPTVVSIAQAIYADRAFDCLPILADALQDAGCEDADVLAHCRGDGPHARGCWVVDGVLGRG